MAATSDVRVAPHCNWDIHSKLVAAIANIPFIEYPVRTSSVKLFDELLENPVYPKDGVLAPRTGHGFDLVLRSHQLQRYRIG